MPQGVKDSFCGQLSGMSETTQVDKVVRGGSIAVTPSLNEIGLRIRLMSFGH